LIDTAFAVSLVNESDENHEKALKLSLEYERQPVLITDCVLLEIGNSLSRNYKKEGSFIIEKFLTTDETEIVRLDETLFNKAFELYRDYADKTWGLVDCVSFVVMRERGITDVLTSDQHFVQAGFNALMLDSIH
jgi:predicted nucleic acid-binding protein